MPDNSVTFGLMKEEIRASPFALPYTLIEVGAPRLSPDECGDLLALLPAIKDGDAWMIETLVPGARQRPRPLTGDAGVAASDVEPPWVDTDDAEFDRLVRYGQKPLADADSKRALELARNGKNRLIRAHRMANIARVAPPAHKRAAIADALTESGMIDDERESLQAIAKLACLVGPDETAIWIKKVFAALSRLDPNYAVSVATDRSFTVPGDVRPTSARCAKRRDVFHLAQ